jgi:hypothetical protein
MISGKDNYGGGMRLLKSRKNLMFILVAIVIAVALIALFSVEEEGISNNPYDVVVWGSDPEGIAAAIAASRSGLNTLLIDHRDRVGGLFTVGELNFIDLNFDDNMNLVTRGIFEEFYEQVGGVIFDIDVGQRVFDEMLAAEELLTVKLNYQLIQPEIDEQQTSITSIQVRDAAGNERSIHGRIFIDASQDADLAYMAGVPFTMGFEDIGLPGEFQASTLVFRVTGVDWSRVMHEINVNDPRAMFMATDIAAWGYDNFTRYYEPENERIRFRGFNMARQADDHVLLNGLLIFGVNAADPESRAEAKEIAQAEAYRFMYFARENLPGFEEATISGFADELYIRQTRHMQGLHRLTIDDVLENRDHWDRIGFGGYPVDIQPVGPNFPGIVVGQPDKYAVPFRMIVPPDFVNLLVVGRSASADSLPHGTTRIVGVGMVQGQAAGVASAYFINTGRNFQEIATSEEDIERIRGMLADQGAFVSPSTSRAPEVVNHPHYQAMQELRRLGLIVVGHHNNYMLDYPLGIQTTFNLLFNGSHRTLNILGHEDLADQMQFVRAGESGYVNQSNIRRVFEEFKRNNPHLNTLYTSTGFNAFLNNLPTGNGEISRGELYGYIVEYLNMLR